MPDNASDTTSLKTQYAEQVAADLENNTKQQERIAADVAALQNQLAQLERDHALLLSVQQALTAAAAGGRDAGKSRVPRVPRARRSAEGVPGRRSPRRSGRAGTGRAARGAGAPTLREVIAGLLAEHDGPCSAAEMTAAVARRQPERAVSPTVVRNTLEALVAKGRAHRSKEQKSVFYSALTAGDGEAGPDGADGSGAGAVPEASGAA